MGIPIENKLNTNPTKQAQELIFSGKVQATNHPPLFFNENVFSANHSSKAFRNVSRKQIKFQ